MMPIEETGKTIEQMQRDYAEKQHKVTSQQERLSNPILWAFWLYSAIAGGFIANQIWSGPFQHFGGTLFRVIMIAVFAVVGLIAAVIAYFFVGVFNASLDQGFIKGGRAAVISLIGVALGAALGAIKGASFTVPSGSLIGLWIGLYVSGAIMGIVATIIFKVTQRGVAEASPWYVKASDRIVILKSEVVKLPPKESPPKQPSLKQPPPQTSASTPQALPQGGSGNPQTSASIPQATPQGVIVNPVSRGSHTAYATVIDLGTTEAYGYHGEHVDRETITVHLEYEDAAFTASWEYPSIPSSIRAGTVLKLKVDRKGNKVKVHWPNHWQLGWHVQQ
jgi:uncharacterized protein YcfJ